jgi:WD40 repeat protein/serine/threonine protein kinase
MGGVSESGSDADPLVGLAEEYAERYRRGERPPLTEYADRYPALADRIHKLFPALVVMEEFGSVAGPPADPHAPPAAAPPRQLGEYRILREVGRGGMGVVYEAVQESLGRHVALKVLPARSWTNPTHLERFRREARAVARLHHTNIVPVFGVGEADGVHFYAMQFIQGQSLDSVLHELKRLRRARSARPGECTEDPPGAADHGPYRPALSADIARGLVSGQFPDGGVTPGGGDAASTPPARTRVTPPFTSWGGEGRPDSRGPGAPADAGGRSERTGQADAQYFRGVARIGVQAAEALAYAHGQGLLHRDVKPGNLLLDTQGAIWVTDFGLAKAEDSEELTSAGDIVGTVRYMAPERFQGHADPRSDVYALGLTLYEMLTLRPAFDATDRARLIDRINREDPPPPRKVDPGVPRDLDTVVLKAIAKEPRQRYPTAAALAEDLQRFLADRPIRARRTTWVEHGWRWCRRNPAVAGLLTTVVALLVVTVVVLAVGNARTRRALAQEQRATDDLTQALYYQWIASAAHARGKNRPGEAEEWLARCPPGLRGWEWHYLKRWPFAEVGKLPHPGDIVNSVAWSPDGRLLASGSMEGRVKVWDARTGTPVFDLVHAQKRFVRGLAFSPDGRLLATGGEDDRVKLWDMGTGRFVRDFATGPRPTMLLGLAFSPNGDRLAAADHDRNVRIWDLADGSEARLPDDLLVTGGLAFTPDGGQVITVDTKGVVMVWDVAARRAAATFPADIRAAGYRGAFSRDRGLLAIGCEDGTVTVVRTRPLEGVRTLEAHTGEISGLAFGAGDGRLATAGDDLIVKVWDLGTGQAALALDDIITRRANSLAFSPDGDRLAVGSADGAVRILDGTPLAGPGEAGQALTLEGHEHAVVGLAYSPDGRRVVSASRDGTAKVWDAHSGGEVTTFRGHRPGFALTGVAWQPGGRRVVSVGWDGTARVWDPDTGAEVLPPLDAEAAGPVHGIAFDRSGSALATAHHDGSVRVWDAASGRQRVCIAPAHAQPVLGVTFGPDGERLASAGGGDNYIKVWDWRAGPTTPVRRLFSPQSILRNPVFSPDPGDPRLVAVVSTPAQVVTWDLRAPTDEGTKRPLRDTWRVAQAVFLPGGRLAVVSSDRVQFLGPDGSAGPALIGRHAGEIGCAAFSPDGRHMATGAGYKGHGEVRIWDVTRWENEP